ncbi:hypothetical protein P8452_63959 [Trifolium repens]|nr:hypothetical protein P8452_63959 [Trifolium repens]
MNIFTTKYIVDRFGSGQLRSPIHLEYRSSKTSHVLFFRLYSLRFLPFRFTFICSLSSSRFNKYHLSKHCSKLGLNREQWPGKWRRQLTMRRWGSFFESTHKFWLFRQTMLGQTSFREAEKTGNNNAFLNLVPLLVGNVALIFTKGDLRDVSEKIAKLKVVNPILMCPKYRSYDSYKTCSYMQSGQLPLGLTCCNQQSSEACEPFLVSSKFSPPQHCYLMRSRQFLLTSIWSPFLLLAGNL